MGLLSLEVWSVSNFSVLTAFSCIIVLIALSKLLEWEWVMVYDTVFAVYCIVWVSLSHLPSSYSFFALISSTVKKMTELKSRGVKMLPSKDNHHKISVCKSQPLIILSNWKGLFQ